MWKIGLSLLLGLFSIACRYVDEIPSGELVFDSAERYNFPLDGVPSNIRLSVDR
jgi:hypothetical protein